MKTFIKWAIILLALVGLYFLIVAAWNKWGKKPTTTTTETTTTDNATNTGSEAAAG